MSAIVIQAYSGTGMQKPAGKTVHKPRTPNWKLSQFQNVSVQTNSPGFLRPKFAGWIALPKIFRPKWHIRNSAVTAFRISFGFLKIKSVWSTAPSSIIPIMWGSRLHSVSVTQVMPSFPRPKFVGETVPGKVTLLEPPKLKMSATVTTTISGILKMKYVGKTVDKWRTHLA